MVNAVGGRINHYPIYNLSKRRIIVINQSHEKLVIFLKRTGNLLIHLLDTCNLYCHHCYLNSSDTGKHELPFDLIRRTMDEADGLGIKAVQFSGGEPMLYPHIAEILKLAGHKKFVVTLSTNATLMDESMANLLAELQVYVVTSIDGPPEYHDKFRGKSGSFKKTEAAVARLTDLGVQVKIVTTVCEENFKHIEWCAAWASEIKAQAIQFQPLENVGRGKKIENKRLGEEHLHDLFIQLSDLAAVYDSAGLQIKMTYKSRDFMIAHPCTAFVCNGKGCHRGVGKELKKIVIREDGTILPELVDIDRRFAIGSLFTNTLENNLLAYLDEGYSRFDQFCRAVYNEKILNNNAPPLIPWNEILTERSRTFD